MPGRTVGLAGALRQDFSAYSDILYSNYLLLWHRDLVPAPPSIQAENINNIKLGGNNQKLMLLSLGNAQT